MIHMRLRFVAFFLSLDKEHFLLWLWLMQARITCWGFKDSHSSSPPFSLVHSKSVRGVDARKCNPLRGTKLLHTGMFTATGSPAGSC
jgi:hypothetical protein